MGIFKLENSGKIWKNNVLKFWIYKKVGIFKKAWNLKMHKKWILKGYI